MNEKETILYPKPAILEELAPGEHAVIEASAGTGKTYTIEHLIVELLLNGGAAEAEEDAEGGEGAGGDVRIDDILVVTYTRRATAELKQRVRSMLHTIVERAEAGEPPPMPDVDAGGGDVPCWEIGPEELRKLKDGLYDFDQASIYTIHGFCQRILTEYAFTNRRLFREEHVDDSRLFEECFYEVLRRRLSVEPELRRWLQAWMIWEPGVESLREELYEVYNSRAKLRPEYDAQQRRELLEAVSTPDELGKSERKKLKYPVKTEVLRTLGPVVERELQRHKRREGVYAFDDMLRLVWESLEGPRGGELVEAIRDKYRWALVDEFQDTDPLQWKIFRRVFFESAGQNTLFLIGDPKQAIYGFRGADVGTYVQAKQTVVEAGGGLGMLERNFRSTPRLIGAYNAIFDQGGEPPYFDAGHVRYDSPVEAGRPELRLEDADGREQSAVELLELQAPEDASVKMGDIRRAYREEIADEIAELLEGEPTLFVSEVAEDDDGGGDGEDNERRPVGPSDIFVLTDTRRRGEEIGEALERRGIRHAFYRKEGLFQTDQARHIYDVLRAVVRPRQRSRRLKAYLTPLFAVPLQEVERVDGLEGAQSPRALLDRWHRVAGRRDFERLFHRVMEDSGLIRRSIFLDDSDRALTNYQHIFEILTEEAHRADRDLEELVMLLRRYIEGTAEPEGEDSNLQRLESEEDAVQIMTIHKSKGLEAEVVFLYGGLGRGRRAGRRYEEEDGTSVRFLVRKLMDEEDKAKGDLYFEQESQRLMYVAVTRAGARLYLPYMPETLGKTDRAKKVKGRYAVVMKRLDDIVASWDRWPDGWFHRRPVGLRDGLGVDRREEPAGLLADWELPEVIARQPEADELFEPFRRRRLTVTSYTRLASDHGRGTSRVQIVGVEEAGEVDDEGGQETAGAEGAAGARGADSIDSQALPTGRFTGIVLHEMLETADFDRLRTAAGFEQWRRQVEDGGEAGAGLLRQHGLPVDRLEVCREVVWRALRSPVQGGVDGDALELPEGLASVDRYQPELEFFYPIPEQGHPAVDALHDPTIEVREGYVRGEIDLLFEQDGRVYFLDWKSNLLEDYSPAAVAEDVESRYAVQIRLYTLAVARMFGFHDEGGWEERFGGLLYAYVRGMSPEAPGRGLYVSRPSWEQVVEWEAELRGEFAEA